MKEREYTQHHTRILSYCGNGYKIISTFKVARNNTSNKLTIYTTTSTCICYVYTTTQLNLLCLDSALFAPTIEIMKKVIQEYM